MKTLLSTIFILSIFSVNIYAQSSNDWDLFAHAKFKEVFVKEFYSFERILEPDSTILNLEGKELTLTGYYVPIGTDEKSIIISKTPYASCFFCGAAGQETVAEIQFSKALSKKFTADQKLSIKGILRLNTSDWEKLSFVLEDSTILSN